MSNKKKIWFPAKTYGYGWGLPCSWQGWMVLLVYIALIVTAPRIALLNKQPMFYSAYVGILTLILIGICMWKGGRPHR